MGSPDPTGSAFIANATPAGMRPGDPLPLDVAKLTADIYFGRVLTAPEISPLIAAARARVYIAGTGDDMFEALQESMVDFLLHSDLTREPLA